MVPATKKSTYRRLLDPSKRTVETNDEDNLKYNSSEQEESSTKNTSFTSSHSTARSEEFSPSHRDSNSFDYGDASPEAAVKHGYEHVSPDDKTKDEYGYEYASPGNSPTRVPQKSSMKQAGRPRRSSIQFGGEMTVKRRTSITFHGQVKVKNVPSVCELTDEPEALWFQGDEYTAIKKRILNLVRKSKEPTMVNSKCCTRGLEKLMASEMSREKKFKAWDSVLDEQDLQRTYGVFDDVYMADLYRFTTAECRQEAADRASQDAMAVENYLKNTRCRFCRHLSM
jgi:hypothetical protein